MKKTAIIFAFVSITILKLYAQCGTCPAQFSLSPTGFTNCPSGSITCNGTTYLGNNNVHIMASNPVYVTNGQVRITFTMEKCSASQGGSSAFTADGVFRIREGSCGSNTWTQTYSAGQYQVQMDILVSNFTSGTKTFYGFVEPVSGSKFWANSVQVTANPYLGKVCISSTTVQGPDRITVDLNPLTVQGVNERVSEYKQSNSSTWIPVSSSHGVNVNSISYTGLQPATSYDFRVRGYNTNNNLYSCDWSNVATAITQALVISAPTINTISANGPNSISLSWGSVSGATDFEIERKIISSPSYSLITTVNSSVLSYTDNTVGSVTTYQYRIRAKSTLYNPVVYSPYSNVVQVTTPATNLPTPQNLTAMPSGTTSIGLNWSSVQGAATYNLRRKTGTTGSYSQIYTGVTNATSYTDNSIVANTQYCYGVQAVDPNNSVGAWSGDVCATATGTTPAITSCTVTPTPIAIGGNLTINWTNPNNGGSAVKIELLNTSGAVVSTLLANTPNDGTETWTVAGVSPGTYNVKVSSINTPSNAATSTNFSINANSSQSITVSAPNATGISWAAGSTQNITWSSVGITGNFKIELVTTTSSNGVVLSTNAIPSSERYAKFA